MSAISQTTVKATKKNGVVGGIIAGLNRTKSTGQKSTSTIHHSNPLYNSVIKKNSGSPGSARKPVQPIKPSSPIRKPTTFYKPGSPLPAISKIQAGSPCRQPRSPLSPKDVNTIISQYSPKKEKPMRPKPIHFDTPRPVDFNATLNNSLKLGLRGSAPSPLSVSKRPSDVSVIPPDHLPPPQIIDFATLPIPLEIHTLPSPVQSNPKVNQEDIDISAHLDKISRKSIIQMDLAVYEAIQLFCCNAQFHRHSAILDCLMQFNTQQLLQHLMGNLNSNRNPQDRRNAADVLSSIVMLLESERYIKERQAFAELLSGPTYLQVLLETMKDSDWVLKSYITGILANLHIEPSVYLTSVSGDVHFDIPNKKAKSSYSFNSIPKIIQMLQEKNLEIREAALTAILCMGPIASSAVYELGDLLLKEKNNSLKILACRALNEIGSPYSLQVVHAIQEVARKDKDELVRKVASEVLSTLQTSCVVTSQSTDSHIDHSFVSFQTLLFIFFQF